MEWVFGPFFGPQFRPTNYLLRSYPHLLHPLCSWLLNLRECRLHSPTFQMMKMTTKAILKMTMIPLQMTFTLLPCPPREDPCPPGPGWVLCPELPRQTQMSESSPLSLKVLDLVPRHTMDPSGKKVPHQQSVPAVPPPCQIPVWANSAINSTIGSRIQ